KKKMAQEKEEKKKREEEKKGRAWYEKFRWFISSEGFIVIAGRDSTTNDIIVKKHMEKDDIVFHTNIAGSPFTIIKTEGKIPGEETKREAAIETASFSRAWKMGISEAEVFQVNPEQVSSSVKSGEYMGKGAFMIYGKRNTMHAEVKLGIGLYDGRIMCAPLSAVRKHCKKLLIITQGSEKKTSAAKLIKKEIGGEIDDIVSALPPGEVKVSKQE
ncbi:MAG: NFACT RNA binding domain-containing protein, partial [Candidatus Woesearchaeota archaeon]|nr:NFACT RNA binding domain-containing protein [Candidatus Woesearchaeota archaeon]